MFPQTSPRPTFSSTCEWCGSVRREDGRGLCTECGGARTVEAIRQEARSATLVASVLIPYLLWRTWQ